MNGAIACFIYEGLRSDRILKARIHISLLIFLPKYIPMSYLFIKETREMFTST
jgi:hypothetical protein